MNQFKTMKSEDMPQEKCLRQGPEALSDAELLAILIRTGTKEHSVLEVSEEILKLNPQFDGLVGLMHFDIKTYQEVSGIGEIKAVQLSVIGEIARRIWNRSRRQNILDFRSVDAVIQYFKEDLRHLDHEVIRVLYLDNHLHLIQDALISSGTCNRTVISTRDIMIRALRCSAVSMILCHNHPAGDSTPSEEDIFFTRQLEAACKLMELPLLDHVIIGDNCYYSFREQDLNFSGK